MLLLFRSCPTLALAWLLAVCAPAWAQQTVSRAELCVRVSATAPCTPRAVALPYFWDADQGDRAGQATLRFELPLAAFQAPDDPAGWAMRPALLLPAAGNGFEVRVNGERVFRVGEPGDTRVDYSKTPHLVLLPPHLMRASNQLEVTLWPHQRRAARLEPPMAGSQDSLTPRYEQLVLWRPQLSLLLGGLGVALGVMALSIWRVQREPLFLAYGLAEAAWGLRVAELGWLQVPWPWLDWAPVIGVCFALSRIAMAWFCLALIGPQGRWPRWLRGVFTLYVLGWTLSLAGTAIAGSQWVWALWTVGRLMLEAVMLVYVLWLGFRERRYWRWLLAAFVVVARVVGWIDIQATPDSLATYPTWTRLVWSGYGLALALSVGLQLKRARLALEGANEVLQSALDVQARQLRQALSERAASDLAHAMGEERQRVMRDMHDGLGAQLSGLLAHAERARAQWPELPGQVRLAIDELRLVVDAMQPFDGSLTTMLGDLRPRLEHRLGMAGVSLAWQVDELPDMGHLGPMAVRHIQRILLEATTNIARHAQAQRAVLQARLEDGAVVLTLSDDGCGLPDAPTGRGHGLQNMAWRAQALGGQLSMSSQGGCQLRLTLPAHPDTPAGALP